MLVACSSLTFQNRLRTIQSSARSQIFYPRIPGKNRMRARSSGSPLDMLLLVPSASDPPPTPNAQKSSHHTMSPGPLLCPLQINSPWISSLISSYLPWGFPRSCLCSWRLSRRNTAPHPVSQPPSQALRGVLQATGSGVHHFCRKVRGGQEKGWNQNLRGFYSEGGFWAALWGLSLLAFPGLEERGGLESQGPGPFTSVKETSKFKF